MSLLLGAALLVVGVVASSPAPPALKVVSNGSLAAGGCVRAAALLPGGVPAGVCTLCNRSAATGWYVLKIDTAAGVDDADQMFGAHTLSLTH